MKNSTTKVGFSLVLAWSMGLLGCSTDDAKNQIVNSTPTAEGVYNLCAVQVTGKFGTDAASSTKGLPYVAWSKQSSGAYLYSETALSSFLQSLGADYYQQAIALTCGNKDADASAALKPFLNQMGSPPCVCQMPSATPDPTGLRTNCLEACENDLANDPQYSNTDGNYSCDNKASLFADPSVPTDGTAVVPGRATTVKCDYDITGSTTQGLRSYNGGLSQYVMIAKSSLNAVNGAVTPGGSAIVNYSLPSDCSSGCKIAVKRLAMSVHNSSFEDLNFSETYAVNHGSIFGTVTPDGHVTIPAGAGTFVVAFRVNGIEKSFTDTNRDAITGTFDKATGKLTLSSVHVQQGELNVALGVADGEVIASPPVAVFGASESYECNDRFAAKISLDGNASWDSDGDIVAHHWALNGNLVGSGANVDLVVPIGENVVALNVLDERLALGNLRRTVSVVDTVAPVFGAVSPVDLTSCDPMQDTHVLTPPPVSDVCSDVVSLRLELVSTDGTDLNPPRLLDQTAAQLPGGDHVVRWTATDTYGNSSSVTQPVRLGPAIVATNSLAVRDRAQVQTKAGQLAAVGNTGWGQTQLGVTGRVAEVRSRGAVFLQNYAFVATRTTSQSSVTLQSGANGGVVQPYTDPKLGNIAWLSGVSGTIFGNTSTSVEPNTTTTLSPGIYGRFSVKTGATLVLAADGDYRFKELSLEPGAKVKVLGRAVTIVVAERFVQRGTWSGMGTNLKFYVLAGEVLIDRPIAGIDLVAPNSKVTVAPQAVGTSVRQLVGRDIEIQPDLRLVCDRQSTLN